MRLGELNPALIRFRYFHLETLVLVVKSTLECSFAHGNLILKKGKNKGKSLNLHDNLPELQLFSWLPLFQMVVRLFLKSPNLLDLEVSRSSSFSFLCVLSVCVCVYIYVCVSLQEETNESDLERERKCTPVQANTTTFNSMHWSVWEPRVMYFFGVYFGARACFYWCGCCIHLRLSVDKQQTNLPAMNWHQQTRGIERERERLDEGIRN